MASDKRGNRSTRKRPSANGGHMDSSVEEYEYFSDDFAQPGAMRPASTGYSVRASKAERAAQAAAVSQDFSRTPMQEFSRNSDNYVASGGMSKKSKIFVIIVILLLVAAIVGLGLFIYKELRKGAMNDDWHSLDDEQMEALDSALTGTQTFDEPFVILLLGTDASAEREESEEYGGGGWRSDTNILMRVDPVYNAVSLLSIQRDTMINIDGVGTAKFNAAYTYGGPSGVIQAVKNLTGVDVDHYAEVNFDGLEGLIDAVGGVEVDVPETIDDYDAGGRVNEGYQTLNGEQALIFARSRAYVDGDYTRSSNQRMLLEALAHKLLETPANELAGIIQSSTDFLTTDSGMDFDFIYSVADQMRHNDEHPTVDIYSANLPSAPAMIGDVSYVIADSAGVADMVAAFMAGEDIGQVEVSSSIDQDIANAGGTAGYSSTDTGYYDYSYSYGYTDYGYSDQTYSDQGYYDYSATGGTGGGTVDAYGYTADAYNTADPYATGDAYGGGDAYGYTDYGQAA